MGPSANFFHFHAVFNKIWPNIRFAPPIFWVAFSPLHIWEILDPPLILVLYFSDIFTVSVFLFLTISKRLAQKNAVTVTSCMDHGAPGNSVRVRERSYNGTFDRHFSFLLFLSRDFCDEFKSQFIYLFLFDINLSFS